MSNSQYRESAKTREILAYTQRVRVISAAVERLYLALGGRALERLMEICDRTLEGAKACREDDARRLRDNPKVTWREKGERPLVSVTEQRLHTSLMLRYMDRKELIRAEAKTLINEAVNATQPQSIDELKELLDALTSNAQPLAAKRDDALLHELLPQLSEADRREFMAALELADGEAAKAVLAKQPEEVRTRYGALAA